MIGYVFFALGTGGLSAAVYVMAPAGRGLHRYAVPRSQLRAEAARHHATAEDLVCKLVALAAELDASNAERSDLKASLDKAGVRIGELEEAVRDRDQLRVANTALQAALANARSVSQLPPHGGTAPPGIRPVPLGQAPFALSPASKPN